MVKRGGAGDDGAQMFLIGVIVVIMLVILVLVIIHFTGGNTGSVNIFRTSGGHKRDGGHSTSSPSSPKPSH